MDEALRRVLALLAPEIAQAAAAIDESAEDIRLRIGQPPSYTVCGQEYDLRAPCVTEKTLAWTLERASLASLYAVQDSLRRGFICAPGGVRVGVCGTGVYREGRLSAIKDISSLSVRAARQCRGIADGLLPPLDGGFPESTLLIGSPGSGKTSLLRDMIRQLSDRGVRTALADERGEIAAMHRGEPGFAVGRCTDVLEGVEKRTAVMMLLRTMAPQLVALDEISERADALAVEDAANNGASLLATVHGASSADVFARPVLQKIVRRGIFRRAVVIRMTAQGRRYAVFRLDGDAAHAA